MSKPSYFSHLKPENDLPSVVPMSERFPNAKFYMDRSSRNLHAIHPDWEHNPKKHPLYNVFKWSDEEYQVFLNTPCTALDEICKRSEERETDTKK